MAIHITEVHRYIIHKILRCGIKLAIIESIWTKWINKQNFFFQFVCLNACTVDLTLHYRKLWNRPSWKNATPPILGTKFTLQSDTANVIPKFRCHKLGSQRTIVEMNFGSNQQTSVKPSIKNISKPSVKAGTKAYASGI